jgi:hypothetical protein
MKAKNVNKYCRRQQNADFVSSNFSPKIRGQENTPHFIKPEVSSPRLQQPTICPYPEPEQASPRTQNDFL